jgi:hypothetical protein
MGVARVLLSALALPLFTWLSLRLLWIQPAQRQLAQAQQLLLVAEREELAMEQAAAKGQRLVGRLRARVATMEADAERMRVAENAAVAQLQRIATDTPHSRSDWVFPGLGRGQVDDATGAVAGANG